ncbi:MAG: CDP-alcohol phosphatidyltransferase family protein [Flavobacteriales bacterium]|nr:CDP-alcohol phosphatidyltransferase family protein [Flavobacteriales bacterium]
MPIQKHIPNAFTLANLICGSISVVNLMEGGEPMLSGWLIFAAAFFDLLDGAVARALGVSGELGKQLDSLADVVSFGLAPSVIAYHFMTTHATGSLGMLKYLAFLNVAAAAIRLARFNISTDQKHDFSGMPSPANGIFWASILLAFHWYLEYQMPMSGDQMISTYFIMWQEFEKIVAVVILLVLLSSWLMVAPVRMFSFKFQPGGFASNKIPFLFIATTIIIAILFMVMMKSILPAIPVCILTYILFSFFYHFQQKNRA